ncbi:MAG: prepilin peptidase [Pseudomonadota bacterium]
MQDQTALKVCLVVLLLAAGGLDLAVRKIPNRLLLAGLLCAALLHLASATPGSQLASGALGFGVGLLVFLPLYSLRGMAAGDVKLMATVGAFTGPGQAFEIALATFCIGGLMALGLVLARRRTRAAVANLGALLRPLIWRMLGMPLTGEPPGPSVGSMPYGVAIALGTWLMLCLRHG